MIVGGSTVIFSNMPRQLPLRLETRDYRQGIYFITIVTDRRKPLFGRVINGVIALNECGQIVQKCWLSIPRHFPNTTMDAYVVMPDHFHGIVACRGTACRAPYENRFGSPVAQSLPTIIRSFKSAVTREVNRARDDVGGKVWQRNYYERVILGDDGLKRVRRYIHNHP